MKLLTMTCLAFLLPALGAVCPARAGSMSRHALGEYTVYCFNEGDSAAGEEKIRLPEGSERLKAQTDWNKSGMNFFVVDTGKGKMLIDAGNAGENTKNMLAEIGIGTEAITDILLTHMHPDHIRGLLDAAGNPVFPKAGLRVAREEAEYWRDTARSGGNFDLARRVLAAYGDRVDLFEQNRQVGEAESIPAFGHTPGHTAFRVRSAGQSLVFWGDITHVTAQFTDPAVYLVYDVDAPRALDTRRRMLAQLAESGEAVAGAHIPAPGIGRIAKADGGYRFTPGLPER